MTIKGLENRATFEEYFAVIDECGRDFDEAQAEFEAVNAREKAARTVSERNWARAATALAWAKCLERYAAYYDIFDMKERQ